MKSLEAKVENLMKQCYQSFDGTPSDEECTHRYAKEIIRIIRKDYLRELQKDLEAGIRKVMGN
jgi:hypothetical protein